MFGGAFTSNGSELEAEVSQTGLQGSSGHVLEAVAGVHSCSEGLLNDHHLLRAKYRNLIHEDVATSVTCICSGTFHFFQERMSHVLQSFGVPFKVLHLSRLKVCAMDAKTGAELIVQGAHCTAWRTCSALRLGRLSYATAFYRRE